MAYNESFSAPANVKTVENTADLALPVNADSPAGTIAHVENTGATLLYKATPAGIQAVSMSAGGAGTAGANGSYPGGQLVEVKEFAASPYVVVDGDYIIQMNGNLGVFKAVTLPTPGPAQEGRYVIVKLNGTFGGFGVIVSVADASNIDGAASVTIAADFGVARFYCSGTQWFTG